MDNRIAELDREQRIALARVVSDLIIADKIIDDEEMANFSSLFGKEDNRELFRGAQGITFAEALKLFKHPKDSVGDSDHIKQLKADIRKKRAETVVKVLTETAKSDGLCAPTEAILLLSIDYFLRKNNPSDTKYDIQSFRLTDLFIGKRFILYADFSNSAVSYVIEEHYEQIVNLLAGIGFQFIYIPKIVEMFGNRMLPGRNPINYEERRKCASEWFKTMSLYLFPDISEEKTEMVHEKILNMTTKTFVQEYLNEKLGFNIYCPSPTLMVMLGRSSRLGNDLTETGLAYETYANFLKIKIGNENVLNVISDFVCDFNKLVTFNINVDFNPAKDKLLYHGIHKVFFRLVALAKKYPNQYNININTSLGAIFINDSKLNLPLGKAAIYALILCRSVFGDKKGLPNKAAYYTLSKEEKDEIQKQYETICGYMQNHDQEHRASLYPNVFNRFSEIRKELDATVSKKFIGEIRFGVVGEYVVSPVTPDHITVNGKLITEHTKWNNLI